MLVFLLKRFQLEPASLAPAGAQLRHLFQLLADQVLAGQQANVQPVPFPFPGLFPSREPGLPSIEPQLVAANLLLTLAQQQLPPAGACSQLCSDCSRSPSACS